MLLLDSELLRLRHGEWPAFVGANGLFTLREGYGSRGRRRLCDNGTRLQVRGRLHASGRARAKNRLLLRNHRGSTHGDRSGGNFPLVHLDHVAAHRARGGEVLRRGGGNRTVNILVHVGDVIHADVFVDHRGVVIVVDHCLVHGGVRNVHVVDVRAADVVRGHEDFARTKRKPPDIDPTPTAPP